MRATVMMSECLETRDSIKEFINSCADRNGEGYAYASGALSVILEDAINLLPKAKRASFRERLYRHALECRKAAKERK